MRRALALLALGLAAVALAWWGFQPGGAPSTVEAAGAAMETLPRAGAGAGLPPATSPGASTRTPVADAPTSGVVDRGSASAPDLGAALGPLVLVVREAGGESVRGRAATVSWRKGFGDYGEDEGRTDTMGRFVTTVGDPVQVESVEVEDPSGARVSSQGPFEPDPAAPQEIVVEVAPAVTIHGAVRDPAGQAVAGATVAIECHRVLGLDPHVTRLLSADVSVRTGAAGRYSASLRGSHFGIVAESPTDETAQRAEVAVPSGERDVRVDLVVPSGGRRVGVQVRGPEGPIDAPAHVWAWSSDYGAPTGTATPGVTLEAVRLRRSAQDLGGGRFELSVPRGGTWEAGVAAEGFERALVPLPAGAAEIVIDVVPSIPVAPFPVLRGRVTSAFAAPGPASIELLRGCDFGNVGRANTDRYGEFSITMRDGLEKEVFLRARRSGHGASIVGPISPQAPPPWVEVVLGFGARIEGVVADADGQPVDAWVCLRIAGGSVGPAAGAAWGPRGGFLSGVLEGHRQGTGPPGRFSFSEIGPGRHEIWAFPVDPSLPPARALVEADGGDATIVLGTGLEDLAHVSGIVRDVATGAPLAGAEVSLVPVRGEPTRDGRSDASGRYEAWMPPGAARVRAHASGRAEREVAEREFPAGSSSLDLALYPATVLRLQVVDRGGRARPGVAVAARAEVDGELLPFHDDRGSYAGSIVSTDAAGRVDLFGLPSRPILLLLGASDAPGLSVVGSSGSEPHRVPVDLSAPPAGILRIELPE